MNTKQVDVWRVDIGRPDPGIDYCRQLLSPEEVYRADRFYFEKQRRRFTVARAATRGILSCYVGVTPRELAFCYAPNGKPGLSGKMADSGIRFNLSHSDDVALLAVTQGLAVGVDIEWVDSEFASQEIAERFFSAGEVRRLLALPPAARVDAFFACWTRKEAYIKALGEGLSVPLNSFEVAFGPGIEAELLQVRTDPGAVMRWSMYDI